MRKNAPAQQAQGREERDGADADQLHDQIGDNGPFDAEKIVNRRVGRVAGRLGSEIDQLARETPTAPVAAMIARPMNS